MPCGLHIHYMIHKGLVEIVVINLLTQKTDQHSQTHNKYKNKNGILFTFHVDLKNGLKNKIFVLLFKKIMASLSTSF